MKNLAIFLTLILASNCSRSEDLSAYRDGEKSFFDRKAEWWFWYQDPMYEEDEDKEEPEKPIPPQAPVQEVKGEPTSPGPAILSTAWLAKNLDTYRQSAMDNPTESNVSLYWWLERVAKDKADRFTQISRKVFYKDHLLNEDSRRPWSDAGQQFFDERRLKAANELMHRIADQFGLFYFFSSDCTECKDIDPVIKSLENRYGFSVVPISVDGKPLEGGYYSKDFKIDAGQSIQLGVERLPTVFITRPPNQFAKIAEGFMPMAELGDVMLMLAEDQGWITNEEYSATLPVNNLLVDPELQLPADTEIDPQELVRLIRSNVKRY